MKPLKSISGLLGFVLSGYERGRNTCVLGSGGWYAYRAGKAICAMPRPVACQETRHKESVTILLDLADGKRVSVRFTGKKAENIEINTLSK